ncbi:MAG: DUF2207 domain-containing protein [Atopobiaceae bacterium]|jgi:hypothetical protein|nr:DUF2207 domain-containing protein [Atopobiaceae bacterium]
MLQRRSVKGVYRRRRRARRHYVLKVDKIIADGNPLGCLWCILAFALIVWAGFEILHQLSNRVPAVVLTASTSAFSNPAMLFGHTRGTRIFSIALFLACCGITVFALVRFCEYGLCAHRRSEESEGIQIEHGIDSLEGLHPVCVSKLVNATGLQDDIVVAVLHLAAMGVLDISRPGEGEAGGKDIRISIVRGAVVTDGLDKTTLKLVRAALGGRASGTVREMMTRVGVSGTSADKRLMKDIDAFFQASHEEFEASGLRDVSALPPLSLVEGRLPWGTTRTMRWNGIVQLSVTLSAMAALYAAVFAQELPTLLACGPVLIALTSISTLLYDPGITDEGVEVARHCAGIREWLSEFTRTRDWEAADVVLWDDILTYAYVLEVSSKVTDELFAIGNKVTDSYADAYVAKHPVPTSDRYSAGVWGQGLYQAEWRARAL